MKILVNSVFVGGYGFNKGNLPHEMINFFRADDGNYYVYVTPYGVIDKSLDTDDLKAILFVRSAGDGLVEVLAKAEIDKDSVFYTKGIQLYGTNGTDSTKIKQMKEDTESQRKRKAKYIEQTKNIKYGGKSLREIHIENAEDNDVFVTLKVKTICFPRRTMYLTHKESAVGLRSCVYYVGQELSDNSKIANQSMKMYFDEEKHKNGYAELLRIVNDEALWLSAEETPKFSKSVVKSGSSFFKVTRQQDNEVMFSNMFFYLFIEYPQLLRKFADDVLKITIDDNVEVEREKERMDIRLIDSNIYVIIENKIKSSINGMLKAEYGDESIKGFKTQNGKYISQLSVYYDKAMRKNSDDNINRTIYGYIFTPNHNPIDKEQYLFGDKYKIVTYKELFVFFSEYIKDSKNEGSNDMYLIDFVRAIKKHTEETDNEFRDELMQRLAYRINS